MFTEPFVVYEISINYRTELQAHSLSNVGSVSTWTQPRRQLLADGTEVDAISGNIMKHYHAVLAAEYFQAMGLQLCPACAARDGRRIAALIKQADYANPEIGRVLSECPLCDTHGFLVTGKNATDDVNSSQNGATPTNKVLNPGHTGPSLPGGRKNKRGKGKENDETGSTQARQKVSKHSLVEYSFGLALPERQSETLQLHNRMGEEEGAMMLLWQPGRSACYGMCIRYKCVGVGVDTDKWTVAVTDEQERIQRHRAILAALRDCILSPSGAMTATKLPHLTGLAGAIVVQMTVGRAPLCSPLKPDYISELVTMENSTRRVLTFETMRQFNQLMDNLIETSQPHLPVPRSPQPAFGTIAAETKGDGTK